MTALLEKTIHTLQSLPDSEQDRIAMAINQFVVGEAVEQGMVDIQAGNTRPLDDVFQDLKAALNAKHG